MAIGWLQNPATYTLAEKEYARLAAKKSGDLALRGQQWPDPGSDPLRTR